MKDIDQIRRENMSLLEVEAGGPTLAAMRLGWDQPQWSNLRSGASDSKTGRPRGMRKDTARRIEAAFSRPLLWLDTDHAKGEQPKAEEETPFDPGSEFVPVARVLLRVSAGITGFRVEHMEGNGPPVFFRADWLASRGYKAANLFALRVSGDSMEPTLWDGDLIVLNSADTMPKDGEVFVANYEGEVVIKRLVRDAGEWWLTSDNQRHKPKRCDEHAELLGRVVYRQSERL